MSGAEQAGPEHGALARRVMVRFVNREGPPAMDPGYEERARFKSLDSVVPAVCFLSARVGPDVRMDELVSDWIMLAV